MNDLEHMEMPLIEKSIVAIGKSIDAMNNLDIGLAIEMYNVVLDGFGGLKESREKTKGPNTIVDKLVMELEGWHKEIINCFEKRLYDSILSSVREEVLTRYEQLVEYYKQKAYLSQYHIDMEKELYKLYKEAGLLEKIDPQVINEIQSYWEQHYGQKIDPSTPLAFYNLTGRVEQRVIPQEVLNASLLPILNELSFWRFYSDKNVYDLLIDADSAPDVMLKRVNGRYFDSNNHTISRSQAFQIFYKVKEDLIVKDSRADDGKSVEKLNYRGHSLYLKKKKVDLSFVEENWGANFILQRVLRQHPMMAKPHKYSVNTFRMVTLRWNNEINYLMTYARFGANQEVKDNGGEGGIVISVSPEGKFSDFGMDHSGNIYRSHPTTGFDFKDFEQIPNFDEYIAFVKKLHNRILHHDYVSWDIAMGVDGKPIFIEMNFRGPIWKYQLVTERPIFGEFTEEILAKAVEEREKRERENIKQADKKGGQANEQ